MKNKFIAAVSAGLAVNLALQIADWGGMVNQILLPVWSWIVFPSVIPFEFSHGTRNLPIAVAQFILTSFWYGIISALTFMTFRIVRAKK
jgi:hypothetical protein